MKTLFKKLKKLFTISKPTEIKPMGVKKVGERTKTLNEFYDSFQPYGHLKSLLFIFFILLGSLSFGQTAYFNTVAKQTPSGYKTTIRTTVQVKYINVGDTPVLYVNRKGVSARFLLTRMVHDDGTLFVFEAVNRNGTYCEIYMNLEEEYLGIRYRDGLMFAYYSR